MTNKNKNLIFIIAIFIIILTLIASSEYRIQKTKENSQFQIDSLKQELFVKEIDLGRYEYIMSNLDSITQKTMDSLFSQTE